MVVVLADITTRGVLKQATQSENPEGAKLPVYGAQNPMTAELPKQPPGRQPCTAGKYARRQFVFCLIATYLCNCNTGVLVMFIRKKILIVDCVEMNRQFLRHILTNAGYLIEVASNSKEALAMLDDDDFDIFFVDIHMPDLDGIKLIKSLRTLKGYESAPILAVTTANPEKLKQKGEEIGITNWIKNPISPPKLLQMLRDMGLINKYQAQSLVNG